MPLAFHVTEMSPPLGVTGRPVTLVSTYSTSRQVVLAPAFFTNSTMASTLAPVTALKVTSAPSSTPAVKVFDPISIGVPTTAELMLE